MSTVAIAGVAATGVVLTLTASSGARSEILKWIDPALSVLAVSSISTATVPPVTTTSRTVSLIKPAGTPTPTPTVGGGMELGINLGTVAYWNDDRAFMNLAIGGGRALVSATGAYVGIPADRVDANLDVVTLKDKEGVAIPISLPTAAFRGTSVEVVCRWEGTAYATRFFGAPVKNVKWGKNRATFTWVPVGTQNASFIYTGTDPKNPVKKVDCREADANPTALFHPGFLDNIKRYSLFRTLNWSFATNNNTPVTWANRSKPGDGAIDTRDGVPIEYMIQLANETKTNPWFHVPWNADDEYVRKMAEMVRDKLDPSLKAYVEVSNEVWNYNFGVTKQAEKEGMAKGYSTNGFTAVLVRYAEKTSEVMDVWTNVFAGQMPRIVRVVATQNSTWPANTILGVRDTAKKVDALATAPYFANEGYVAASAIATPAQRDAFFVNLDAQVDKAITYAKLVKGVAAANKLRYIAYEGGQHILGANGDFGDGHIQIQRDPRMGKAYTRYLSGWQRDIGDLLTLYQDVGRIGRYGSWGQQEYAGQPLSEAPKANAVDLFRKSYLIRK